MPSSLLQRCLAVHLRAPQSSSWLSQRRRRLSAVWRRPCTHVALFAPTHRHTETLARTNHTHAATWPAVSGFAGVGAACRDTNAFAHLGRAICIYFAERALAFE